MPLDPTWRVQLYDADGNSVGTSVLTVADLAVALATTPTQFPAAPPAWAQVSNKPSTFPPVIGANATDAVAGNDAKLTNNRKPGFVAGDGGTVTQNANKTTAVTLNKLCGQITMNGAALAAAAEVTFTVNNNLVTSTDVPVVCVQSVGTAGAYLVTVGAVANGSFSVTVSNVSTASLSQAVVLNFVVIKAVNS